MLERLLGTLPRGGEAQAAIVDRDGRNALVLACMAESTDARAGASACSTSGVDPELRDHDGKRAIDRAAEAGRWSLVAALDRAYPLPASAERRRAAKTMRRCPTARRPRCCAKACATAAPPNWAAWRNCLRPPNAARCCTTKTTLSAPDTMSWLLAQGADAEVRDAHGDTVLFASARRAARRRCRRCRCCCDVAFRRRALADWRGSLPPARPANRLGADLSNARWNCSTAAPMRSRHRKAGDPPLSLAVRLGWSRLVDRLLATGVDLNARDSHGMSALHLAAALGREGMLKRLVAQGAAPDLLRRRWPDPARRGAGLGPPRPGRLARLARLAAAEARRCSRRTCRLRRSSAMPMRCDACSIWACRSMRSTPRAARRCCARPVAAIARWSDLLLARGADPQRAAHSGATPLSAAVSMRHVEIVDRLLAAGAPLEQRLPGDLTVLMVACALGLTDLAARLLAAGADVQACDAQGRQALHCAAMFGFTARDRTRLVALLDTLLLAGVDAD